MGQLVFQATAGGQVALVGPNPSSNFSLNVPAVNATLATTAGNTFTAQQVDQVDASINGLTVGKGGGSDASNTVVGYSAFATNSSGTSNSAFARFSLNGNTSGSYNSAFGTGSLQNNTTGSNNAGLGYQALLSNTTASNNTAVGYQAGYSNTTGDVTVFGYQAGFSSTTATGITFIGSLVGKNNTASNNTVVGGNVNGVLNPAFYSNTTGNDNAGLGNGVLTSNTTGAANTAIGSRALANNTTASNNTAVGYQAGYSTTTQSGSTYIGYQASYYNSNIGNTVVGTQALYGTNGGTGAYNTVVGYQAGYSNNGANGSTLIGYTAGYSTTGGYNTFIGNSPNYGAGYLVTSGTKNTIIGGYNGNQGGLDIRTASNYIVLSDGDGNPRGFFDGSGNFNVNGVTNTYGSKLNVYSGGGGNIVELHQTGTGSQYQMIFINGNGAVGSIQTNASSTLYNTTSDKRLKEDKGISTDTSVIDKTIIHDFAWLSDGSIDKGVFAQEAKLVKPSAVSEGTNQLNNNDMPNIPWSVDYSKYVPDLIVYCQQLNKTVKELNTLVTTQAAEIAALKAKLGA